LTSTGNVIYLLPTHARDRQTDGQRDGWTYGQADGQTEGKVISVVVERTT